MWQAGDPEKKSPNAEPEPKRPLVKEDIGEVHSTQRNHFPVDLTEICVLCVEQHVELAASTQPTHQPTIRGRLEGNLSNIALSEVSVHAAENCIEPVAQRQRAHR